MSNAQPQRRALDGNADHESALDTLFEQPGTMLRIFERSLSASYNTQRRHDALRSFLLAKRNARVKIALHDASNFVRDCPRLMNVLRDFSHAIEVRETLAEAKSVYDPFAVIDERDYVHRFHYDQPRGLLALGDPEDARIFVQRFEDIWEASQPAVSASTLGL
jgi:hypothetical protein